MTTGPTMVAKEQVQGYFGSHENLATNLLTVVDETAIKRLLLEE
jgi:hypothetical protein